MGECRSIRERRDGSCRGGWGGARGKWRVCGTARTDKSVCATCIRRFNSQEVCTLGRFLCGTDTLVSAAFEYRTTYRLRRHCPTRDEWRYLDRGVAARPPLADQSTAACADRPRLLRHRHH